MLTRREFIGAGALLAAGACTQAEEPKKNTRFAVNIQMWWRKLPFLKRIRQAASLGFPAVEFWPWEKKDIDKTAELCRSLGVAVAQFTAWGFRPGLNNPKNHAAFVKKIGKMKRPLRKSERWEWYESGQKTTKEKKS